MNDVRQLLKNKEYIETAMQRADPLMRLVMQRQLDVVCAEIKEALEEWHKGKRGAGTNKELRNCIESPDAELKNRIAELSETARGAGGYGSTGK
jgi:dUTPase